MLTNREFARRFKLIRMQSGASQIETAKAIYRNENHIKNIESGVTLPTMRNFFKLCDFFNVTPQTFFKNEIKSPFLRLKQLREQRGITQIKLALDLNLSQNSISRYESGERQADYSTLVLLADYFNVSVDYLLNRTNNPIFNEK